MRSLGPLSNSWKRDSLICGQHNKGTNKVASTGPLLYSTGGFWNLWIYYKSALLKMQYSSIYLFFRKVTLLGGVSVCYSLPSDRVSMSVNISTGVEYPILIRASNNRSETQQPEPGQNSTIDYRLTVLFVSGSYHHILGVISGDQCITDFTLLVHFDMKIPQENHMQMNQFNMHHFWNAVLIQKVQVYQEKLGIYDPPFLCRAWKFTCQMYLL